MTANRKRLHRGSISVSVDVDVDIEEVMRDMGDDELLAECEARGLKVASAAEVAREDWFDLLKDIRAAARSADRMHMEVLMVRMLAMARVPKLTILSPKEAVQP